MTPQETFVTRLRRQRMRARVSIEQIADSLRIKPEIIAAFEANDLSEWPKGLYSRAWIRTYALSVDLDPVDTVDEFCRLFPQGDRRAGSTIQEFAAIVASPSEYRDEHAHPEADAKADAHRLISYDSLPLERPLFAPMSMNLHAAHHLWTSIPYYNLALADREMRGRPEAAGLEWRGSYLAALLRYFRALPLPECRVNAAAAR